MKSHQPKETVNKRLAGGIWLKLGLVSLLLFVALPQIFSAHAGAGSYAPQGFLFTVTTTDDHNDFSCDGSDCTLREAIDAANNAGTEDFIDFSVTGTINLTSALPDITDDVEIIGPGATMLTVQRGTGVGAFRIFNVTTTGTVTFSGLTISKGNAFGSNFGGGGGGIQNFSTGTVNVTNCTISDNSASNGGGILNIGTLNVTNCIISDNTADSFGGGIYSFSFATTNITNSTISGNDATRNNEGGGGIVSFGGIVNVTNSTISDNSARIGGGIHNFSSGEVNVVNSTIHNNLAERGGGGGGIFNQAGIITITNSTISSNRAVSGTSGAGEGGGIFNAAGTVSVTNSTISGSEADAGGGIFNSHSSGRGIVNVTNSTISDNSASAGAGIDNGNGTVNVTNSTIRGNFAAGFNEGGGGIQNRTSGPFNVKSSIIALNTAAGSGPDVFGTFTSQGFNLIGKADGSSGFSAPTDLTGTIASPLDPKLDPNGLQDNGGPTRTVALLAGSPAIDKGTRIGLQGPLLVDQRGTGFPRTFDDPAIAPAAGGDNTDIGAFELQPLPMTAGASLLINESCPPANGAIDPGERVTVNLELINTSGAATSNLVATLQPSSGLLAPSGPRSYGAIAANSSAARDFSFTASATLTSGQTITATLQLQDGAINLGTVSFNFTAGPTPCSFVRLVVTSSLSRADASTVIGAITVQNIGSVAANDVTLTTAKLGATNGTPLPQGLGNLAPGELAGVTVNFVNSTPGAPSTLTAGGTYAGGTFSSSKRVTIP
jgi:CSLREA domain-containing protein